MSFFNFFNKKDKNNSTSNDTASVEDKSAVEQILEQMYDYSWAVHHNKFDLVPKDLSVISELEAGQVYTMQCDPRTATFFLTRHPGFKLPTKVYGDTFVKAAHMLETFGKEKRNMGILLTGLKGTGKSLLAQTIAIKSTLPIILVNEDFTQISKSGMLEFIMKISYKQQVVFFFDEFEKNFHSDEGQSALLGILDGITACKALYLLTSNQIGKINDNFIGRPGRVRYLKVYQGLDLQTIKEVVEDRINNKSKAKKLYNFFELINNGSLTLDKITKFIDEVNYYPHKEFIELLQDFNLIEGQSYIGYKYFDCTFTLKGNYLMKCKVRVNMLNFDLSFQMIRVSCPWGIWRTLQNSNPSLDLHGSPFDEKEINLLKVSEHYFYNLTKEGEAMLKRLVEAGKLTQEEAEDLDWTTEDINMTWFKHMGGMVEKFELSEISLYLPGMDLRVEMKPSAAEVSRASYGMGNLAF